MHANTAVKSRYPKESLHVRTPKTCRSPISSTQTHAYARQRHVYRSFSSTAARNKPAFSI